MKTKIKFILCLAALMVAAGCNSNSKNGDNEQQQTNIKLQADSIIAVIDTSSVPRKMLKQFINKFTKTEDYKNKLQYLNKSMLLCGGYSGGKR